MDKKYIVPIGITLAFILSLFIGSAPDKELLGWKSSFEESNFKIENGVRISKHPIAVEITPEESTQYYLFELIDRQVLDGKQVTPLSDKIKFKNIYALHSVEEYDEYLFNIKLIDINKIDLSKQKYFVLAVSSKPFEQGSFNFNLGLKKDNIKTSAFVDPNITACGTLSSSGIYDMVQNITITASPCVILGANSITLNGTNNFLIGNNTIPQVAVRLNSGITGAKVYNVRFVNTSVGIEALTTSAWEARNITYNFNGGYNNCGDSNCSAILYVRLLTATNISINRSFNGILTSGVTTTGTTGFSTFNNINLFNISNTGIRLRADFVNMSGVTIQNSNLTTIIQIYAIASLQRRNITNIDVINTTSINFLETNDGSYYDYVLNISNVSYNNSYSRNFASVVGQSRLLATVWNVSANITNLFNYSSPNLGNSSIFNSTFYIDGDSNATRTNITIFNVTFNSNNINSSIIFSNYVNLTRCNFNNATLVFQNTSSGFVYENVIRDDIWVNVSSNNVAFNITYGNEYRLSNGTGAWEIYELADVDRDSWADGGANYPLNSTNAPNRWIGFGADWRPKTYSNITPIEIRVEIWNGTNWTLFNDTSRLRFRCRLNGTYPILCEPNLQNASNNTNIMRIWNFGENTAVYQAVRTNVTFQNCSLLISRNNNTQNAIIVSTNWQNFSTETIPKNTSKPVFLWLNITSMPCVGSPFLLNFSIGD